MLGLVSASITAACPDLTRAPHSQWRTAVQDDVHWLVTPCGEHFFSIGINAIDGGLSQRFLNGRLAYHWGTFYPDLETWGQFTLQRVLAWGFNTAGGWSLHPTMLRLPTIPYLELGRSARFHWYDPLHPATAERMRVWARHLVAPYTHNPFRIGYFSDNEVGWWNGALFAYYLKQPATNHTKRRLIAFIRDNYRDDWQRFTRDFVPPAGLSSFEHLLHNKGTFPQLRPGGMGIQVVRQWTTVVADHYYHLVHDTLREADPQALIFGDRLPIYYDPMAVRAMLPYVDVIATNYDVDSPDGWIARYFFEGLRQLAGEKPVLISEWFFAAHENRSGNRNNGHLMTVRTQAERVRGAVAAVEHFAREPNVVGTHWFQYYDHPQGGREDGEDYNFGLVDIYDRPYPALVQAFGHVNQRLADRHQQAAARPPPAQRRPWSIPKAAIDARERSLAEWPKKEALAPGLVPSPGEIVFADLYVAWDTAGLHLAVIGMDYYDPDLLAYGEEFPLEEAFRVDWGMDTGSGPQRFALYIIPPKQSSGLITTQMYGVLCRTDHSPCAPVPSAVTTYFGSEQPRLTVEVSLPWQELGIIGPPWPRSLRLALAVTAWHRSRWMSMDGRSPEAVMQDPARWRVTPLGGILSHVAP
jgi:hypothetical protein